MGRPASCKIEEPPHAIRLHSSNYSTAPPRCVESTPGSGISWATTTTTSPAAKQAILRAMGFDARDAGVAGALARQHWRGSEWERLLPPCGRRRRDGPAGTAGQRAGANGSGERAQFTVRREDGELASSKCSCGNCRRRRRSEMDGADVGAQAGAAAGRSAARLSRSHASRSRRTARRARVCIVTPERAYTPDIWDAADARPGSRSACTACGRSATGAAAISATCAR